MKAFKGKAIYNPSGKAGEYSYWACNFYVGCSNGCVYCYCKNGILAGSMGQDKPQLKKCFRDEDHALEMFEKEVFANKEALKKHGLFFSFTTDPMLLGTIELTQDAIGKAQYYGIPCKILTKCADWVDGVIGDDARYNDHRKDLIAYGFTFTGHDELEPGASTNQERIEAMKKLHNAGFKTFASIEPIIDFESSYDMIDKSWDYCDLFKIGLESGKRYDKISLRLFISRLLSYRAKREVPTFHVAKLYFKDSLLKQAGIDRETLPENCVGRDYNMFERETGLEPATLSLGS